MLPQKLSESKSAQERTAILDEFFNTIEQHRRHMSMSNQNPEVLSVDNSPSNSKTSSPLKKSPMKSPMKKQKHDENSSPVKGVCSPSKCSPTKEGRPRRRRAEASLDIPLQIETKPSENGSSPLKSCPKSPLKRMKSLEEKDEQENQENIETTYIKAHAVHEDDDVSNEPAPNELKSILGSQNKF
jgi:hypothetical protein